MSAFDDDDGLAAELVIGTLDPTERAAAEARRFAEPAFEQRVQDWTRWLSPLLETATDVEPDPRLRETLLARVEEIRRGRDVAAAPADAPTATGQVIELRRQLRVWRLATAFSLSAAALLALWIGRTDFVNSAESATYMAVLQQGGTAPAFLVSLDLGRRRMTVAPSAAVAEPGKSLELWMIAKSGDDPRSLGLLDAAKPVRPSVPDVEPDLISHATYAITVEQEGGSPSGKPTSTPIYAGLLVPGPR